jgi:hypothetical protein
MPLVNVKIKAHATTALRDELLTLETKQAAL